ncbi:MAG TPA: hypothetical protein VH120_15030, partial [Gemmataceae bacterium]|nr:hypothetical protein [Gemmataceae bacterium]
MKRITFGLISLLTSVMLIAHQLGLIPDRDGALMEKRVSVCEAIAVETALAVQRKDMPAIRIVTDTLAKRNPEILSAGVRDAAGHLVASAGDHGEWTARPDGRSTPTQMVVPIMLADRQWGQVEVRFKPLGTTTIWGRFGGSWFPLLAFTSIVGFGVAYTYLRAVLRHVEPGSGKVVPDRIRDTLNALVEGVVVLDKD